MLIKLEGDVVTIPNTFIKLRFPNTYVIIGPNPYTYNSNKTIRSYMALRKIHERILIFCEKVFRLKPDSVKIFEVQYNGTFCNSLIGRGIETKIETKVIDLSQARYYYNTNVRVYLYISDTDFQKLIQRTDV